MKRVMITALLWQTGAFGAEGGPAPEQLLGLAGLSLAALGLLGALFAIKTGFIAMAVWLHAQWPRAIERTLQAYQTRGTRCFWVGLVNTAAGLLVALLLIASGGLALFGLLLALSLFALATTGYAAAYRTMGARLQPAADASSQVRTIVLGGAVLELAFLVPILGQILSLGTCFRGTGAAMLALMAWRRKNPQPQSPTDSAALEQAAISAPSAGNSGNG